jgi:hypothetical protein
VPRVDRQGGPPGSSGGSDGQHERGCSHPPAQVSHGDTGGHPPETPGRGEAPSAKGGQVCTPSLRSAGRREQLFSLGMTGGLKPCLRQAGFPYIPVSGEGRAPATGGQAESRPYGDEGRGRDARPTVVGERAGRVRSPDPTGMRDACGTPALRLLGSARVGYPPQAGRRSPDPTGDEGFGGWLGLTGRGDC